MLRVSTGPSRIYRDYRIIAANIFAFSHKVISVPCRDVAWPGTGSGHRYDSRPKTLRRGTCLHRYFRLFSYSPSSRPSRPAPTTSWLLRRAAGQDSGAVSLFLPGSTAVFSVSWLFAACFLSRFPCCPPPSCRSCAISRAPICSGWHGRPPCRRQGATVTGVPVRAS